MQTGDLLLFKGNGLFSNIITALPGSDYSHVAMVANDGACVFESTSIGTLPDIVTGEILKGVQLTKLNDRIATYDGKVFHRAVTGVRDTWQLRQLDKFIADHHGKPYEQSNWELASAELDIMPWHVNKPDDSSLFCSETVAMALRAMQILQTTNKPANEFTPSDFADDLGLLAGFTFGDLVEK